MSNFAKNDDILRMKDDCGEESMSMVCSLIFFSFIYFKSAKSCEEKRSRILASFAKVYTRKKTLKSMIRENSSTRKKLRNVLLLFFSY